MIDYRPRILADQGLKPASKAKRATGSLARFRIRLVPRFRSSRTPLIPFTASPLEAAERIVAVPLREQKFDDDGGAWPHILPRDHSGGHPGARGNNLFLMGVLLAGLKDYHEVTGDPAVAKSLISCARWVLKSWDEDAQGWPYSTMTTSCCLVNRPYLFSPISHTCTRPVSRIRPAGTVTFLLLRSCSVGHTM